MFSWHQFACSGCLADLPRHDPPEAEILTTTSRQGSNFRQFSHPAGSHQQQGVVFRQSREFPVCWWGGQIIWAASAVTVLASYLGSVLNCHLPACSSRKMPFDRQLFGKLDKKCQHFPKNLHEGRGLYWCTKSSLIWDPHWEAGCSNRC